MARSSRRHKSLWICIACGLLCALFAFMYLQSVQGQVQEARAEALARYGGEQLEVCVATRDIAAGELVEASAIQTRMWLVDLMPADAVRSSSEVLGRRTSSPILKGEVVSLKRFQDAENTFEVPEGLTAVSVPAKDVQAVGGAITPGMKVDLYATGSSSTQLIGESIAVLATNATAGSGGEAIAWITIAVEPESVQEIVAAAQGMQLYFTLPNQLESQSIEDSAPPKPETSQEEEKGNDDQSHDTTAPTL